MIGGDRLSVYILASVAKKFTTLSYTINNINSYLTQQLTTLSGLVTTVQGDITTVQGIESTLNTMFSEFNPKYTNFTALWYGPVSGDPTKDALGNPPIVGAQCYDTSVPIAKIYVGTSTDYPTGWKPYDSEAAATAAANAAAEAQDAITTLNKYGLVYPSASIGNYVLTISEDGSKYQARSPSDTLALIAGAPLDSPALEGTPTTPTVQSWATEQIVGASDADARYLQKSTNAADYTPLVAGINKANSLAWLSYTDSTGASQRIYFQPSGDYATNATLNANFIKSGASDTAMQIASMNVITASGLLAVTRSDGTVVNFQPAGDYATNAALAAEVNRATQQESNLSVTLGRKANISGGNTFSGVQLTDAVSNWGTRQIVDALSANSRFAIVNSGNAFVGNQTIRGSLQIISSDNVNRATFYSDTGNANGGNDLILNQGGNYFIFRQNGTIGSTSVGEVLFYNGTNRVNVPGGTLAYLSDISITYRSGNVGDPNSWTMIKTIDPSTPSGYRIRMFGETDDFYGEGSRTIVYPYALNAVLPGMYGCATKLADANTNSNTNDQGAQIRGTPTATSLILNMNYFGGGQTWWPIRATWWVEGY